MIIIDSEKFGVFHRYIAERFKQKAVSDLNGGWVLPHFLCHYILSNYRMPRSLHYSFLEEMISFGLIEKINKQQVRVIDKNNKFW